MKLSHPQEYIKILLEDITQITKIATDTLYHERYHSMCCPSTSMDRFNKEMLKVDQLKQEILSICGAL